MTKSTESLEQQIVNAVAAELSALPQDLKSTDITSKYRWLKNAEILFLRGASEGSSVVFVQNGGFTILNSSKTALATRVHKIGEIVYSQIGTLPGLSALDLASAIRTLAVDPRGYIANAAWRNSVAATLDFWLVDGKQDAPMIKSVIAEPSLQVIQHAEWELQFRYLNHFGGIEGWVITGNPSAITKTSMRPILPNGSLRNPMV